MMEHGILLVNKPAGISSFGVVSQIKKILHPLKVGHGGTLDPEATGVLPLLVGRATKWAEQILSMTKTYRFTLRLGKETDTDDLTGVLTREAEYSHISEDGVRNVLRDHLGDILQIPPMYSALRHKGRRLYDWAREGHIVPRKARPIKIYSMDLLRMQLPYLELRATCSRGTYVRTLCRDMGQKLGSAGCMEFLVRERIGDMHLANALDLALLSQMGARELKGHLKTFEEFSKMSLNSTQSVESVLDLVRGCSQ